MLIQYLSIPGALNPKVLNGCLYPQLLDGIFFSVKHMLKLGHSSSPAACMPYTQEQRLVLKLQQVQQCGYCVAPLALMEKQQNLSFLQSHIDHFHVPDLEVSLSSLALYPFDKKLCLPLDLEDSCELLNNVTIIKRIHTLLQRQHHHTIKENNEHFFKIED